MASLEVVRGELADAHKDTRLNLQAVLEGGSLTPEQRWGVAVASAYAVRNDRLKEAILNEAKKALTNPEPVIEDARAAASLMAMNNVYYRFRHMIGKESYSTKRAGLRMNRLAQVLTNKVDFELVCLAVSAINGCEMCMQAHEKVVLEGGLSEDQVHDAVRIAAVIHAAAVGLES
ncbi:alkyl hydroperoxide reductase [Pyxidicoccus fallax]|uniref:Alkyl hydroperoxide reductase AhpD n=1 Tax=Pyxidicoccus fallax TaxID=394095 RepID=A0A848LN79_9BACT|nr:carboxymuconolactone decarboxylase family protein [Pyxidicoccus fallax]NMO19305.1 alkyl hydroperoxide reductase [Pyxidicoccus fallax]NPC81738.1 alkyl hydroperoxide reductase [Pyxidicoccus fallax]